MQINYNKNPLYTTIDLDDFEKKELWYKIKLEEMEHLLWDAHFHLEEGKYFNIDRARNSVDYEYYCPDNDNEKSPLDQRCDMLLQHYLADLQSYHVGDCTCVACSCSKCHAEVLLGIDTMKGLEKHSAYKINGAFGQNNEKTIDEAILALANYNPIPSDPESESWKRVGGYEAHVPRWIAEAKLAHDWLVNYKNEHFNESENKND